MYKYIATRKTSYEVKDLCCVLKVSESGYYRYERMKDIPTSQELLSVAIYEVLEEHPDNNNYGVARMRTALANKGIYKSAGTVRRVMRQHGLLHKRRKPHGITKATTEIQEQENIIKRDFSATAPLQKLLCDITEIPCADGKLYLSAMLDCFDGEIVSLEMRDNMKKELCIDTVKQLKNRYGNLQGTIIHSDRGSQYTSEAYRKLLKEYGVVQSLSGTGHCFDNARMESFFATLKKEKIYQIASYKMTMETVKSILFRYIYTYYNRQRIYTSNPNGLPPAVYREQYEQTNQPAA